MDATPLLNVQPKERTLTALVFVFSLFMGIVQGWMVSVPLAMFLALYSSTLLPLIYIAIGVATFIVGALYSFLQKNLSFFNLLVYPLIFLIFSLLFFWGMLFLFKESWATIALLIWGWLVLSFTSIIFGALINRLFTLQQGKRLFGIIGSGGALGGIIAGGFLPLLVRLLGANHIILLSAISLSLALVFLLIIRATHGKRLVYAEEEMAPRKKKAVFSYLLKRKYLLLLFAVVFIAVFEDYTLDMLFNTEAQKHFTNEKALASFLGIFYAVTEVITLLVALFVFGPILEKWGVVSAISILPVVIGAFFIITAFLNIASPGSLAVFALIVFSRVIDDTLHHSINSEAQLLLFQPLKPAERVWAQMQNEASVNPLATIVIGAILLLLNATVGIRTATLIYFLIALCLLWIVILFVVRSNYTKQLLKAVSKHILVKPNFKRLDKKTIEALDNHLKSPYAEEVLYVLHVFEATHKEQFYKHLLQALDHPEKTVRLYAIKKVEEYRLKNALPKVEQLSQGEQKDEVVEAALKALGAIGDNATLERLKQLCVNPDTILASSSLIALIKHGSSAEKTYAIQLLKELVTSDKERAARVLKEVSVPHKGQLLLPLLKDPSPSVSSLACIAGAGLCDEALFPLLIENLKVTQVRQAAFLSLTSQGNSLLKFLKERFKTYDLPTRTELMRVMGHMQNKSAASLVFPYAKTEDKKLMQSALHALRHLHFHTTASAVADLKKEELRLFAKLKTLSLSIDEAQMPLIHSLIQREIGLCQERLFSYLLFVYPQELISKAELGLKSKDEDRESYALEILFQTLNPEDNKTLIPILTYKVKKDPKRVKKSEKILQDILHLTSQFYIKEMTAAVVYTIGKLNLGQMRESVEKLKEKQEPLLQETIEWTLQHLKKA